LRSVWVIAVDDVRACGTLKRVAAIIAYDDVRHCSLLPSPVDDSRGNLLRRLPKPAKGDGRLQRAAVVGVQPPMRSNGRIGSKQPGDGLDNRPTKSLRVSRCLICPPRWPTTQGSPLAGNKRH